MSSLRNLSWLTNYRRQGGRCALWKATWRDGVSMFSESNGSIFFKRVSSWECFECGVWAGCESAVNTVLTKKILNYYGDWPASPIICLLVPLQDYLSVVIWLSGSGICSHTLSQHSDNLGPDCQTIFFCLLSNIVTYSQHCSARDNLMAKGPSKAMIFLFASLLSTFVT